MTPLKTTKKDISNFIGALAMCGIGIDEKAAFVAIEVLRKLDVMGADFSIKDASKICVEVDDFFSEKKEPKKENDNVEQHYPNYNYPLLKYFLENHNVALLDSDIREIVNIISHAREKNLLDTICCDNLNLFLEPLGIYVRANEMYELHNLSQIAEKAMNKID